MFELNEADAKLYWDMLTLPQRGTHQMRFINGSVVCKNVSSFNVFLATVRSFLVRYNAYISVLPVDTQEGYLLWVDYDHNDKEFLASLDPAPSMIVGTGNGYHCYWVLSKAVSKAEIEEKNYSLCKRFGTDHTWDAARVLRVPGTYNKKFGVPTQCRILEYDPSRVYDPEEFPNKKVIALLEDNLIDELVEPSVRKYGLLPEGIRERIADGHNEGEDRSAKDYLVCGCMVDYGFSNGEIAYTFLNPDNGISGKTLEHGRYALQYVSRMLVKLRGTG